MFLPFTGNFNNEWRVQPDTKNAALPEGAVIYILSLSFFESAFITVDLPLPAPPCIIINNYSGFLLFYLSSA